MATFGESVERRIRERGGHSYSPSPEFVKSVEEGVRLPLTEGEKGMLGGLISADGSILHHAYLITRKGKMGCFYGLEVFFGSGEEKQVDEVYKYFTMYGYAHKRFEGKEWVTEIFGVPAKRLIRDVLPYLVGTKKEAGEMALKHPAYIHCLRGRPPLPRVPGRPQPEHTPRGKVWATFFEKHGRLPTVEEWEEIKPPRLMPTPARWAWAEFYQKYGRPPTDEEWERIKAEIKK